MSEYKIESGIPIPKKLNYTVDGMKGCSLCYEVKSVDEFYFYKTGYYSSRCKRCDKIYREEYRKTEHGKKLHRENQKRFIERNPEYDPKYRRSVSGKINGRESQRRYREKNPNYNKEYSKTERGRESQRKSNAKRVSTPEGKINNAIKCGIHYSLKGNKHGRHWEELVGYTSKDLMNHLESQFEDWMNWDNYSHPKGSKNRKWCIDHIVPIFSFNFNSYDDVEFKKCWALENLRPLDFTENMKKSNKIA